MVLLALVERDNHYQKEEAIPAVVAAIPAVAAVLKLSPNFVRVVKQVDFFEGWDYLYYEHTQHLQRLNLKLLNCDFDCSLTVVRHLVVIAHVF